MLGDGGPQSERIERERVRAGGGELMADLTTQRVIPPDKTLAVLLTYRLLQKGRGGGREPSLRW